MVTQEELIDFIKKVKVRKPNNPGQSYAVEDLITNIPKTVELLFEVVNCSSHESLNRFDIDFFHHLTSIVHLSNFENIPIAIEGLSQKYESFLKKIAYLKYKDKDPRYFYGDKHTKGINGTGLGRLCEGILDNTERANLDGIIPLELPDKLLDYKGINRYFADYVRTELRNKVHYSKEYPRNEIILLSEIVVVLYLITIQDNFQFLSNLFIKESRYINSIAEQFKKWQSKFVHILGVEESDPIIGNIDLDFIESDFDLTELEEADDTEESDEKFSDRESGKISELLSSNKRLVIVGSPGMGKTTTMQFLCFQLAKSNDKIPVYLELRNFTEELDLVEELSRVIGIEEDSFYDLLNSERLVILIDGVNEVIRKEARTKLFQQVNYLLKLSDKFNFIASSRKSAYHNDFNLPIFQLQLMNDEQISEFIAKNYSSNYSDFFELLKKNTRINEWARNPLMLTMLISVAKKTGGKIPDNTGKLLKTFIDAIYKREIKRNPTYNPEIAQILLSHLAFTSREDKLVGFKKAYALQILANKKNELGLSDDILSLLNSFIDINILYKKDEQIGFAHELYQEYFAAEELLTLFSLDNNCLEKYVEDKNWLEVIILFNGLVEGTLAVKTIANVNPLVAAIAINDNLTPEAKSINMVLDKAMELIQKGDNIEEIASAFKSLISLKQFDNIHRIIASADLQNKSVRKGIRKAITESYYLISHNDMILLLKLIWKLYLEFDTKVNFLSAFFTSIPVNGLYDFDSPHQHLAEEIAIEIFNFYCDNNSEKLGDDRTPMNYRNYLLKPLIVISTIGPTKQSSIHKIKGAVNTLIGVSKPELAYPIIKKFKIEREVDLMKMIKKLCRKNSPQKAKLLASLYYDDEFELNNKKEVILKTVLNQSTGIVYKTAVELAIENGYNEKMKDIIDKEKLEKIINKSVTLKINIPEPKLQFQLSTELSLHNNLELFNRFCDGEQKLPMQKYIELFLKEYPSDFSILFKLLGERVYKGTVVAKFDYGFFINCPMFQRTKTVFAHSTQTQIPFEEIQESQEVNFQIIGYNKERQRINTRLC